jgi:uncharacterized protein YktB (UPF0637 family)
MTPTTTSLAGPSPALFEVFAIPDFEGRMAALRREVRPWLEGVGAALAPELAAMAGEPLHPHVARHARRTVNPPDDTWVAFGPDRRGYKKERHFKVALSRQALRLVFEIGPEFEAKPAWAAAWRDSGPQLAATLGRPGRELAWFRNEHDEEPAEALDGIRPAALAALAEVLTGRRDGQLVLGRRLPRPEAAVLSGAAFAALALDTFRALAPCYHVGA